MKIEMFALVAFAFTLMSILVSPVFAQLGSQSFPSIDFKDNMVTDAELDIVKTEFSKESVLPNHPFYPFKRLVEDSRLFLTFGQEAKAKLHLSLAKTRLAETKLLTDKNETKLANETLDEFNEELAGFETAANSSGIGENVSSLVKEADDALGKSRIVLALVLENAPDEAKAAIENAMENAAEKEAKIRFHNETRHGGNDTGKELEIKIKNELKGELQKNDNIKEQVRVKIEENELKENKRHQLCIQVITPAENPKTGECKDFPTPCDVPKEWEKVSNCQSLNQGGESGSVSSVQSSGSSSGSVSSNPSSSGTSGGSSGSSSSNSGSGGKGRSGGRD